MTPSTQKMVTPLIQGRWVIMVCGRERREEVGREGEGEEERRKREGREEVRREGGEKGRRREGREEGKGKRRGYW